METTEEIVLKKLNTQKRSAFNILNDKELCDRIVNENPIWLDDFAKEYGIGKSIIQRLVKSNVISSFSNLKGKGSKIFIFKDEVLRIFKLEYKGNEFFESVHRAIELYLLHVKDTLTHREYETIRDVLINKIPLDVIAEGYDLTRLRVRKIFDKANIRVKNSYRISVYYEKLKSEYEALKYEVEVLKQKRMTLSKSKVFEDKYVISDLFDYKTLNKNIWDLDISVRLLNVLRKLDLETLGDVVSCDRKRIIYSRNIGVKTIKELDDILQENKLHFGMNIPKLDNIKK